MSSGLQSGRYETRKSKTTPTEPTPLQPLKKKKSPRKPATLPPDSMALEVTPSAQADLRESEKIDESTAHLISLHPDDNRNNRLEIEFGSGIINDSSSGNETYRVYSSTAPFAEFQSHFWLSPQLGFSAGYRSTLSESFSNAVSGSASVQVKSEWESLSFDSRIFYGSTRRANSLQWGVTLTEYKLTVPSSENSRVGLRSDQIGAYLKARLPISPHYAWLVGGHLNPIENNTELQTNLNLSSGTSPVGYQVGLFIGGEVKFNRQSRVQWKLGANADKTNYSGMSNLPDPANGQTPSGVSILNTWTYLNLGYIWGE